MISAYFNGKFVDANDPVIPIDERGHQFGDGVYEVIRIYNGKPFMLEEHVDRLYQSAYAIKLQIDPDCGALKNTMLELIRESGLINLDLYVQVTRGMASRNHLFPDCPVSVSMTVKPFRTIKIGEKGAGVTFLPDERWQNCFIKSLNLLPNILAKQSAYEKGFLEAVLVRDGKVTEGTSSNVYIVKNSSIITTPLSKHILSGITRMAVKGIAIENGIPFIEKQFTPDEMIQADEIFITSTTMEIMPIVRVEDHEINGGEVGTITRTLQEQFKERIFHSIPV
ncbi:D-amino-acid transaminase [Neobacillus citreus]|uniref:D-alanine aminotransferase n=1 Tax=Neobacillus citreus TaxID=2833578 RepID=A0A942T1T4_9BACI|nr:D-amino-acid transaminase [Neobacillus citreus]MCH6265034.1 D-amino-acid transaminase [Neobacillus citreus]